MSLNPEDRLPFLSLGFTLVLMTGISAYFWLSTGDGFFAFLTGICAISFLFFVGMVFGFKPRIQSMHKSRKRF
jgi:hypothetical protein